MFRCLSSSSSSYSTNSEAEGESAFSEILLRLAQTMSCFFGCFRVKDSSHPLPTPEPVVVVSRNKNALSALFISDDEPVGTGEKGRRSSVSDGIDFRELEDEAKFLKACGTLPETPFEIRKCSSKWESITPQNGEDKFSKFDMEKLSDKSPIPVENCEETSSLDETPSSCMTDGHDTRRGSISSFQSVDTKNVTESADVCDGEMHSAASSLSPVVFGSSLPGRNKCVRFENDFDGSAFSSKGSSYVSASQGFMVSESCGSSSVSKPSPDSTPLKLTDEMKSEVSDSECPTESTHLNDDIIKDELYGKYTIFGSISGENLVYGRTPGDRPILGMVAAHWKDEEDSHTSHPVWDGNGIPNSTNKYKEDQKVRFHATPFEERLEKALSEGSFVSQRNPISGTLPVTFEESEESDTALSRLQSSAHSKPVVSF